MSSPDNDPRTVAEALRRAGCVAADEEAEELLEAAGGSRQRLEELITRRCEGEPLAWLTGSVRFCGEKVLVHKGVYVPRWQTEALAGEAVRRLPADGVAVDLCTGSGAIALVLARRRRQATVVATDIDPVAVACARANGVEAVLGDMAAVLPLRMAGETDVVTAVAPYVPRSELHLLPRDVLTYEPLGALDGGDDGTVQLRRAAAAAAGLLRPGGSLLLELGGEQSEILGPVLSEEGYREIEVVSDADGDVRAVYCRR